MSFERISCGGNAGGLQLAASKDVDALVLGCAGARCET